MDHTIGLLEIVQKAFTVAVELSCGSEYCDMFERDCGVKVSKHHKKNGDLQSTCPQRIFNHHIAEKQRKGDQCTQMNVTTTSEYGLVKLRRYNSARELGLEIIACLPEAVMKGVIADVLIDPTDTSNTIRITTAPHFQWHLQHDRHPCTCCGRFCQGSLGLRTHQVPVLHKCTGQSESLFSISIAFPCSCISGI